MLPQCKCANIICGCPTGYAHTALTYFKLKTEMNFCTGVLLL